MTVIRVPFHQDDRLPDDSAPLPAGTPSVLVDPDLPALDPPGTDQWTRLAALHGAVADAVAGALAGPAVPVVVSGDCLVALGTLAGAQRAGLDPGIVWLDAHGDVHTLASSQSGYLGGMVLRMAVGGDPDRLAGPLGLRALPEERAVLVDARDLDAPEVDYLAGSAITRLAVEDVTADRLAAVLPDGPFVLHVDLDVVDSAELPGLLFPAPDGPAASAVLDAVRRALATGRVAVLDVACPWHPARDAAEAAVRADLVAQMLAAAGVTGG
ncbi:arginase family protein [Kineosporia sp. A_224]|uniref:arginase family protein n=1 Tax=Kineosporia sp. A_224 TaxID=1962180 RepID=UPI000B4A7E18|nr:arginase family protein [Kineosporia sp. A_224]